MAFFLGISQTQFLATTIILAENITGQVPKVEFSHQYAEFQKRIN
jgi:hypothetical protein